MFIEIVDSNKLTPRDERDDEDDSASTHQATAAHPIVPTPVVYGGMKEGSPGHARGSPTRHRTADGDLDLNLDLNEITADANAQESSYDFTDSGTITIKDFEIKESGITRTPLKLRRDRADAANGGAEGAGGSGSGDGDKDGGNNSGGEVVAGLKMQDSLVRLGTLGRGASSTVYKAFHVPTLKLVAVKVIPVFEQDKRHQMVTELQALYNNMAPIITGEGSTHRQGHKRDTSAHGGDGGEREKNAGCVPCPHIVTFYDAFITPAEGDISIVVEYMDGGSLQDIVDTGGCSHEGVLANISFRVLHGLSFLHDRRQVQWI
jgi:hypothetical protein